MRSAASWPCSTATSSARSTSATPASSPCWSWPTWCSRSRAAPVRSSTSRCRRTTRRSAGPTSRWPVSTSGGNRRSRCATGWRARPSGSPPNRESALPDTDYKLLSVIVPVYNERNTVTEILRRMRRTELPIDLEVIVVDDGSTDGTDRILQALEDSTVRVLRHPENRGKGAAVRTGLDAARGDLVLIQDADLEYDPDDWNRLLGPVLRGRTKVVFGSRYLGEREAVSLRRWMADRGLSLLTSVLYNSAISDMQTCLKLVDRQVLESIDLRAE